MCERATPDYLVSTFPRLISGWCNMSRQGQQKFIDSEKETLAREGYELQADRSYWTPVERAKYDAWKAAA